MLQPLDQPWINSTCAYCGVGCGIKARNNRNGILEVQGDDAHPANYGRLCSKGMALGETVVERGRLLKPQIDGAAVEWSQALSAVAEGFQQTIEQYGPDSVALYVSGQLLTEDYYIANKLMKGFVGSANIDTNSRLCMASSVAGHKRAFGSDTVAGCYEDLELADLLVLVGSNLAWCHPVLFRRIEQAKQSNPDFKLVVIDPRQTDSCSIADLHLPIESGSDVALFNGLLSYLSHTDALDNDFIHQHTSGFSEALARAEAEDIDSVASKTGLAQDEIEIFFRWFAQNNKTVTVYSQGVNQSSRGVDKVNSIINCHLATGRIGKPGATPFSITGQPNAMGGREVGGLANALACHMNLEDPLHRQIVSEFWSVPDVPDKPGLKAVDMFDAVAKGDIKAIWIMGTNPVVSMPRADKVREALEQCPLVVVSDCIEDTDTTRCADILLPAQGWGEKSGTVTNSERRISRQRNLMIPLGEARPDWWIISQVAQRMGYSSSFSYQSEADIFREYAAMSAYRNGHQSGESLRDFNIGGLASLTDQEYEQFAPRQWPVADKFLEASQRFFADGQFYTNTGKANFIPVTHNAPANLLSADFPLTLNTGRIRDQWHTMTRTGLSSKLSSHCPEPFMEVHPETAKQFGLSEGAIAQITSSEGNALARVKYKHQLQPSQVFMPIHWSGVLSSKARVDALVGSAVDEISGQPEFKHTPVSVQLYEHRSEAVLVVNQPIKNISCEYWVQQTLAGGYLYFLADKRTVPELADYLNRHIEVAGGEVQVQSFIDSEESCHRRAVLQSDQLIAGYWLAKKLTGEEHEWLGGLLSRSFAKLGAPIIYRGEVAEALLQGQTVCSCKQVGQKTLCKAIENGCGSLSGLMEETSAGTGCGSCVPQLKQLLEQTEPA